MNQKPNLMELFKREECFYDTIIQLKSFEFKHSQELDIEAQIKLYNLIEYLDNKMKKEKEEFQDNRKKK